MFSNCNGSNYNEEGLDLLLPNVYMSMKHDRVCCFLLSLPPLVVFGLDLFVQTTV